MEVVDVLAHGLQGDGENRADADAAEGQAADAGLPAADFGKNDGVGDEAEVENSIYHRDVNSPENAIELPVSRGGLPRGQRL